MLWQGVTREDARRQRAQLHAVRVAAASIMSREGGNLFGQFDRELAAIENGREPETADIKKNQRELATRLTGCGAKLR